MNHAQAFANGAGKQRVLLACLSTVPQLQSFSKSLAIVLVQAFMTEAGEQGVLLASLGTIAEPGMLPAPFVLPFIPMHQESKQTSLPL